MSVVGVVEEGRYKEPVWPQAIKPRALSSAASRILQNEDMLQIMTDNEFLDRAERLLQTIEHVCDHINETTDADLDNQRVGGMVTISFANRSQIVVNLQKPLHEVWMAARDGGYHFKWADGVWQDTKGSGEFFVMLSRSASAQAGVALRFDASF